MINAFTSIIITAVIGGALIAATAGLLGTFLVSKRLSLLGDGLAHVAFAGVALGLLIGVNPVIPAFILTVLSSIYVMRVVHKGKTHGDAATAIVLTAGIGIATLLIGVADGFNTDILSYLFGNILLINEADVAIAATLLIVTTLLLNKKAKELILILFDEDIAHTNGVDIPRYFAVLSVLTGVTVGLSIQAVGILLTSALLVLPALIARNISSGYTPVLITSAATSTTVVILGILLSIPFDVPSSAIIVLLLLGVLGVTALRK